MIKHFVWALLLVSCVVVSATAFGQSCVRDIGMPITTGSSMGFVASGFPSAVGDVTGGAVGLWQGSCGGVTNAYAAPSLLTGWPAERTVTVQYVDNSPWADTCGYSDPSFNLIEIYGATYNFEHDRVVSCGTPDILMQTLAHEIGHLLGLDDVSPLTCPSYIMAGLRGYFNPAGDLVSYGTRSIQQDECREVDYMNITPYETGSTGASCDDSCPVACDYYQCPLSWPTGWSPILVDMAANGYSLTGLNDTVRFDLDANGHPDHVTWTRAGSEDAFLCLDRNGNGVIDNGAELFGNHTPLLLSPGGVAANGFIALAEFDKKALGGNEDGRITAADRIYRDLRVWVDRNHDGVSQSSELRSLSEAGILELDLGYVRTGRVDEYGNQFRFKSRARILRPRESEPRWVDAYDVFLQRAQ